MSALMSWLFRRGRSGEGSGEASRRVHPLPAEEAAQQWRVPSSSLEATAAGDVRVLGGPLFVDFDALEERQGVLLEGLVRIPDQAALVSFVGTGITDPGRYEDAAGAFNQLRHMAPTDGALIQVFRQQLREESKGDDFLFVHFAGDPLSFGFLVCALTGGGLMAGWKLG
jgi:hypothetical protein